MQALKLFGLFAINLFISFPFAMSVNGADSHTNSSANKPLWTTEIKTEELTGLSPVMRAIVSAGQRKFTFLVPLGFRVDASTDREITIINANYDCFMRVRSPGSAPHIPKKLDPEILRQLLLSQHPNGKILREFSRTAGGHAGLAFDLERNIMGDAIESVRSVFILSDAGLLEFKLVTTRNKFNAATFKFNTLLLSFSESKNGKLEIAPLSDKF